MAFFKPAADAPNTATSNANTNADTTGDQVPANTPASTDGITKTAVLDGGQQQQQQQLGRLAKSAGAEHERHPDKSAAREWGGVRAAHGAEALGREEEDQGDEALQSQDDGAGGGVEGAKLKDIKNGGSNKKKPATRSGGGVLPPEL
ncbi:uncharacterized protein JN550_012711 [Neoarthrinium moseri]|uniref:uncharacterized protein n=1 Tax=Neoarthrinium moseri TaxID=1658444 RepID=UPI001FDB8DC6|nr:uncharacterized protein JN550_012711 [Neoarthrinium moseri]KAI1858346.1 hypothetical protein JN550_012711 [Neoarthrinium moseri]